MYKVKVTCPQCKNKLFIMSNVKKPKPTICNDCYIKNLESRED